MIVDIIQEQKGTNLQSKSGTLIADSSETEPDKSRSSNKQTNKKKTLSNERN